MQSVTSKIDDKIRKLQELKRIASDPEMLELWLETVGSKNGTPPMKSALTSSRQKAVSKRGAVLTAAKQAVATIDRRFTAEDVLKVMKNNGFSFTAANPKIAVNGSLRKLIRKGLVKVAKAGSGRMPSEYERIQRNSGD